MKMVPRPLAGVKSFKQIPGPKSYPLVGTLANYILTKKYTFDRLHWNGHKKFDEFGPIVREEIVPGVPIVWLFDPNDIQMMYANEGTYPARRSHLALEKYRLDRPHLYSSGGLLPTNGPEWLKLRQECQKPLALQSSLAMFNPGINSVVDDFMCLLKSSSYHESFEFPDFLEELKRFFMEITGVFLFGTRLGSLDAVQSSLSKRLIDSAFTTNANILKTDHSKLWKYLCTKEYNEICQSQKYTEDVALSIIESNTHGSTSLIEILKASSKLTTKDLLTVTSDMLLAGVDTTSYTMSYIIYLLSKNQTVQDTLRDHVTKIMPRGGLVDQAILRKFSYGKAVLKESQRLYPVSVGVGRVLAVDAIFSGYHVPAGTVVVTQNQVSCRLPEFCPEPETFLPERWIKNDPAYQALHPYLSLPFGFGPRMCIGRRISEQTMLILLVKLMQNFKLQWAGTCDRELDCKSYLINQPDQPIRVLMKHIK